MQYQACGALRALPHASVGVAEQEACAIAPGLSPPSSPGSQVLGVNLIAAHATLMFSADSAFFWADGANTSAITGGAVPVGSNGKWVPNAQMFLEVYHSGMQQFSHGCSNVSQTTAGPFLQWPVRGSRCCQQYPELWVVCTA